MKRFAPLEHVLDFGAVLRWTVKRRLGDLFVGNRNPEAGAEGLHLFVIQLLLLVRDVLAFARFADAVSFDGAREHHGRHLLGLDRILERVVNLGGVVAAERQLLELLVGKMLDHVGQTRVRTPEVLAHIRTGFDGVLLILAVHNFAHALDEQPFMVLLEQVVPLRAPDRLDDIPASATEDGFQFLDDLTVAAHRTVEPLQIAVDDEDQVVELLARRQGNGTQGLRFIGLTIAEEGPDLRVGDRLEATVFEVAIEARLIDRHDGTQPHRDGREFPKVRHQPGMRIRRQPAARLQLAAEVLELLERDSPFEERACVDARRAVPLKEDDVAFVAVVAPAKKVVEPDLVQRCGRRER